VGLVCLDQASVLSLERPLKYKLLLDENMPDRALFPRLNELFDVKHIREDLNIGGLKDPQVYFLAA
jgi:hypothetical protein